MLAAQTATPTPLYATYAAQWSLEPITVSAVFAAYVVGLTIALLSLGSFSDYIGRRPVALAALTCAATAMVVLATADGVEVLVVGRILQGLAAGLGMAALGAALIDHAPVAHRPAFAAVNSALLPIATGLGAVVSALVLHQSDSLIASYVVQGAGIGVAIAATLTLGERHPRRPGAMRSLRPDLVVPPAVRPTFLRGASAVAASWSLVGLYLGLGPVVTATIFGIDTPLASALAVASASGTGGVASVVTLRLSPRRAMLAGCWLLLAASGLVVASVTTHDAILYFSASTVGGFGFGTAFQGGLRRIVAAAPPEHRAGVMAALYLVSYLAFGLPSLCASLFVPVLGLEQAVMVYAALIALLATGSLLVNGRASAISDRRR